MIGLFLMFREDVIRVAGVWNYLEGEVPERECGCLTCALYFRRVDRCSLRIPHAPTVSAQS